MSVFTDEQLTLDIKLFAGIIMLYILLYTNEMNMNYEQMRMCME